MKVNAGAAHSSSGSTARTVFCGVQLDKYLQQSPLPSQPLLVWSGQIAVPCSFACRCCTSGFDVWRWRWRVRVRCWCLRFCRFFLYHRCAALLRSNVVHHAFAVDSHGAAFRLFIRDQRLPRYFSTLLLDYVELLLDGRDDFFGGRFSMLSSTSCSARGRAAINQEWIISVSAGRTMSPPPRTRVGQGIKSCYWAMLPTSYGQ